MIALRSQENPDAPGGGVASSGRGGHARSIGFADINVSREAKRYIHIVSLILIFGSYLYLRLRKAKKDAAKRSPKLKERKI